MLVVLAAVVWWCNNFRESFTLTYCSRFSPRKFTIQREALCYFIDAPGSGRTKVLNIWRDLKNGSQLADELLLILRL